MEETMIVPTNVLKSIVIGAAAIAVWSTPSSAKDCYAPDARAQERAFSRAVTTEGGKTIWLGGQTGSPNSSFENQTTEIRKEIFKECFPGSALITVSGFARPGLLIEIQGTAVVGGK